MCVCVDMGTDIVIENFVVLFVCFPEWAKFAPPSHPLHQV